MLSNRMARKILEIQMQSLTCVRQKNTKNGAIQRMKELKSLFGDLQETKKDKVKRVKLEEKKVTSVKTASAIDSELYYFSSMSKNKLNIEKKVTKDEQTKKYLYHNIQNNGETKNPISQENHNADTLSVNDEAKVLEMKTEKTDENGSNNVSNNNEDIKLNSIDDNILQTPMLINTKKKIDEVSSKILSLSSKDHNKYNKYPSVTRILNATMSEESKALLDRWEKKMIAKLGIEGFKLYRQELLRNGKHLHTAIQNQLLHEPLDIHESIAAAFKSVNNILKDMSDVKAIESHVLHPQLQYRGYLDCIARYRGKLCVVDWKKSDKQKNSIMSTYDAPLQVASYIGALNADEKYPFEIQHGLIVVAYTNGEKATVHEISGDLLQLYWKSWLERLQKYKRDFEDVTAGTEIKSDP